MERIYGKGKRTVGGRAITSASIKPEGEHWRWIIRTASAIYVDGGNYLTREQALVGLDAALDPVGDETLRASQAAAILGRKGGKAGRGASQVRGYSEHYRALVARRKDRI